MMVVYITYVYYLSSTFHLRCQCFLETIFLVVHSKPDDTDKTKHQDRNLIQRLSLNPEVRHSLYCSSVMYICRVIQFY